MKSILCIVVVSLLTGCAGELDLFTGGPEGTSDGFGTPVTGEEAGEEGSEGPGTVTEQLTPGFELPRDEVRLLPFHVRVEKLTRVTGVDASDPLFDQVWRSRYDLGDHNYGQGIGPDLSWNASKMATWVRALRPICASDAMATRFDLPQDSALLIAAAYGREPSGDEVSDYVDALAAQQLDEAAEYEAVCLSVLTSSEFVAL